RIVEGIMEEIVRRLVLTATAAALPILLACTATPTTVASASPISSGSQKAQARAVPNLDHVRIGWKPVARGFASPTQVASARDGESRLFVVEKSGRVKVVRRSHIVKHKYLNLSHKVTTLGEGGLLSIAFSPTFRSDKLLFVAYARRNGGDLVIARMKASRASAPQVRNKTLRTLMVIEHSRYDNHYGGQLMFGPDGKLYIGTGDGGGSNDVLNTAGQRTDFRGKILRINPFRSCRGKRYCIPHDNPFVGKRGRDQIWLMGVRNPWRFSFDRRTSNLWIGDVGQDSVEEIDRVSASPSRINLGWSCREGDQPFNSSRCRTGVKYLGPVATVDHPQAEAITGGFVYRGDKYRKLLGGAYIFADYVTRRVWAYSKNQGKHLQPGRLGPYDYAGPTSFGVDDQREILAVTYDGTLWRMRASHR
ncbi:MAG TPA: PQQ-dependent sugar dehydrogenase, partial [Actinomycetes bacterium]|nr:PQQ-dependent sugar dehydrogenase [Actinomycetes bacterium]